MDRQTKWLLLLFGMIVFGLARIIFAPSVRDLTNTEWHLNAVQSTTNRLLWTPTQPTQFTLWLNNSAETAYGFAGCHNYSGKYHLNNGSIRFQVQADANHIQVCMVLKDQDPLDCLLHIGGLPRYPETMPAFEIEAPVGCADAALTQHQEEYFQALNSAIQYEWIGHELRVYFDEGNKVLVFSTSDR